MNKRIPIYLLLAATGPLFFAGCATPAHNVEPDSSRLIKTVGRIDIQDFAEAADDMTQSLIKNLIDAGKLQSAVPAEPALMAISHIKNSTGQQLETDLLVKKIRVALNLTGKIQTSATIGINGPEDPLAADQQKAQEFFQDQKHTRLPDYTLSGNIIQLPVKDGNVRQSSYVFQLSLSSSSGVAVWEDEKTIIKQGTRPSVGF